MVSRARAFVRRVKAWWDRSVWSQIREARETAASEARRADDLAARLTRVQRELDKKRHENRKLREQVAELTQWQVAFLEIEQLPEVEP